MTLLNHSRITRLNHNRDMVPKKFQVTYKENSLYRDITVNKYLSLRTKSFLRS